jgi:hypothetical protein
MLGEWIGISSTFTPDAAPATSAMVGGYAVPAGKPGRPTT